MKLTQEFVFDSYKIQENRKTIYFKYKVGELVLNEKIILPDEIPDSVSQDLLNQVLQNLHLMLGVSYFKMYCPKKIIIPYRLSKAQADFWNTVYTKGLGEFFYKNKIDFRGLIDFPYVDKPKIQLRQLDEAKKDRFLVGIGGGKDSIVAIELLKEQKKEITGFILETQVATPDIQMNVLRIMEIDYFIVKRQLDSQIFELEQQKQVYIGHIPISAIYAFVSLLLAVIYDYSSIVTANEKSANFGNVNYLGMEINHQWSKSEEFEKLFNNYISQYITPNINYFSNLRSYSEMEIAKMFSSYKKYFPVFSSCNKNFKIKNGLSNKKWCGQCPKCVFVFITLAANLSKEEVIAIFDKNLLDDSELIPLYQDLIGKGKMKPFDCVGTFEESVQAFKMIKNKGEFNNEVVMKTIEKLI